MNIFRIVLAVLCLFPLVAAEPPWTHLKTENFEIYTTAGEKRGREAILYFEQVRALFEKLFKSSTASKIPVRIIAFRNEKEFLPFRPGQAAAAYYSPGIERDYIVMESILPEHFPIAVHEYMHRVVHSMGLELPIWLDEGLAELFATLKPVGNKVQMGQMEANRAMVVRSNKMIPFSTFMSVDHHSPYYNEREKAGMFYAQSFVLAHMLYFGEGYDGKFGALQVALSKTKDPAQAFQATYGRPLEAVQKDLEAYMAQSRFFYGLVNVKLEKAAESPEVLPVDEYESKVMVADLYRVHKNCAEAARLYEAAAKLAPEKPDAEEGLGWLALYENQHDQALPHFVKAIESGSTKPVVFENAARLSWKDSKRALAYMQRAAELDPDLKDANLTIGRLAMNAHQPRVALDALNKIKKVTPDKASALFRTKAYAYLGLDKFTEAKDNAELAKKYAKTDPERSDAEMLLTYFEKRDKAMGVPVLRSTGPPSEPEELLPEAPREMRRIAIGELLEVTCEGKQPRLTVAAADGAKSIFLITDPDRVEMKNADGITHEFTCGPQKNTRVKVGYAAAPADSEIKGLVRSIDVIK